MSSAFSKYGKNLDVSQYASVLGRILLASIFIYAGLTKLLAFEGVVQYIESKSLPYSSILAVLTIALELVAGALIVVGYKAKVAAFALALFTLLAAVLFHNFWTYPVEQQHVQTLLFIKNISIAGGLLFLSSLGSGSWSLDKYVRQNKSVELAIN